jgi:hypothetical protein
VQQLQEVIAVAMDAAQAALEAAYARPVKDECDGCHGAKEAAIHAALNDIRLCEAAAEILDPVAGRLRAALARLCQDWGERFLGGWNSHDPGQLLSLATDDVTWVDPFAEGKVAVSEWLVSVWRAFPDLTFETVGEPFISIDGGRLAMAWKGTATFTGRLEPAGVEPTGGRVEGTGIDEYEFADGLVRRVVTEADTMSLLVQIGAAPAPPAPATSTPRDGGVAPTRLRGRGHVHALCRRQHHLRPLPRHHRALPRRQPSSLSSSRTRGRSITGPVSAVSTRGESPSRGKPICYRTSSKPEVAETIA